MTLGYFVPAQADSIQVKFLSEFEGYIWSFPRADHLSVGICGSMSRHTSQELHRALEQFLREQRISAAGARFYSHVLPSPQARHSAIAASSAAIGRSQAMPRRWSTPSPAKASTTRCAPANCWPRPSLRGSRNSIPIACAPIFRRSRTGDPRRPPRLQRPLPGRRGHHAHDSIH